MTKIENLNFEELKFLLKQVNKYKSLRKQLGKRGVELFNQKLTGKNILSVEYFNNEELALQVAIDVYKKTFGLDVKREDIKFVKNENIKGGIKVYSNDSMVDISFSKIEKLIK